MAKNYGNLASTAATASPVGPSDLTATLATFSGYPAAPFWAEFEKGTVSAEIVLVTNVAGNVVTITRGQGGTSATSHGAGVTFEHVVTAVHFNDAETHQDATSAHGVTGNIVGTSGAQTIQDKTYRGAHRSLFSDALPAGVTSSYESSADTAAARDGFVHKNTAGDANKRGFLLQQSGTDRVQVFNDGTVDIAPGASARPGLRNHGTTTLDGTATLASGLVVAGAVDLNGGLDVAGGLVVAGGAIITGTTALNTAQVTSLVSSGAVSGTNGSFTGTLGVTGVVTAAAAVNAASVAATGAVVGDTIAATNQVTSYGGRVIPCLASAPASPVTGQVYYHTVEIVFYRWSGTTWVRWVPFVPRCEVRQTSAQVIGSGAWTALTFQAEDLDTHAGHAASATSFIVTAGWDGSLKLKGGVGWAADTGTSRGVRWAKNGTPIRRGAHTLANSSTIDMAIPAKSITEPVVATDVITLEAWQNKGSNVSTSVSSENQAYMSIEWVQS